MPPPRHISAVFLKFPEPGRVKSRLGASIGHGKAVEVYEELVRVTLGVLAQIPGEIWVFYEAFGRTEGEMRAWLERISGGLDIQLRPQSSGDLGERLKTVSANVFGAHEPPATLSFLGADCPYLQPHHLLEAREMAGQGRDGVFGPAEDGGYYLLTVREHLPCLFDNIPWSSDQTLAATLTAMASAGLRDGMLERLPDIDTIEDLNTWRSAWTRHPTHAE